MHVDFTKAFDKQFQKLPYKKQAQAKDAVALFLEDPAFAQLRNHELRGRWRGYRSISAGGDLRLHYKAVSEDRAFLLPLVLIVNSTSSLKA